MICSGFIGISVATRSLRAALCFEAARLERLGRVLREDEGVVAEQVVDVHALGRQELVRLAVADRELEASRSSPLSTTSVSLLRLQRAEGLEEALGLDLAEVEARRPRGAGLPCRTSTSALVERAERAPGAAAVAPVARARRVGPAAADVDGRADRAVTRAAGALLLVELLRAAADRRALLGRLRCPAACEASCALTTS